MENTKMCLDLLRPKQQEQPMFGEEPVADEVILSNEQAEEIAALLEKMAEDNNRFRDIIHIEKALTQQVEDELKQEKRVSADLRKENKIIWSALYVATGRIQELQEGRT